MARQGRFGINEHSDMLNPGKEVGVDVDEGEVCDSGSGMTAVAQGDRHAIKAEDMEKRRIIKVGVPLCVRPQGIRRLFVGRQHNPKRGILRRL
jgi:hypothetical protein